MIGANIRYLAAGAMLVTTMSRSYISPMYGLAAGLGYRDGLINSGLAENSRALAAEGRQLTPGNRPAVRVVPTAVAGVPPIGAMSLVMSYSLALRTLRCSVHVREPELGQLFGPCALHYAYRPTVQALNN